MTITRIYNIGTVAEFAEFCSREVSSLNSAVDDTEFDCKILHITVEEAWFEPDERDHAPELPLDS